MKTAVAAREQRQTAESEHFLSCMKTHCEQIWDERAAIVPGEKGEDRELSGREFISYLTVLYGAPEIRLRFMREWEKALDDAGLPCGGTCGPKARSRFSRGAGDPCGLD